MRLSEQHKNHRVARIARRLFAVIALSAVALPSTAVDLVQSLPHLWVSATALSLTLAAAASRPKN